MTVAPEKIYRHMPDLYTRAEDSDLCALVAAEAKVIDDAEGEINNFEHDLFSETGFGLGLSRLGENYDLPRPPGMADEIYRDVLQLVIGARRGTVAIVKQALEAATGQTWICKDHQLDPLVPPGVICCYPLTVITGDTRPWCYADLAPNYDGFPMESGHACPIINEQGEAGAIHNDHAYDVITPWVRKLASVVKLAGIILEFKYPPSFVLVTP